MADTSWMARVGARLVTNGYAILPIAPGTKKPGQFARAGWHDYPQWNRHASRATTEFEVATWSTWPDCGAGIVGGAVAALDIDVAEDGELALRIERLARERLGDTPALRIGKPPKRLLVYRTTEPFAGIRRAPLEMLCLGQQFVAYAEHPDTGQPYAWPDEGLADLDIESLPEIDAERAAAFLDEALALIPPELRPKSLGAKAANGAGHPCLPGHAQA
ncbi:MAG: bifunctional DNA primase/polymerase, partial [Rhodobacteraceae bacterium]|nr:bifunctional DNA primase/polymerase [Paracoccaceae bacterium]